LHLGHPRYSDDWGAPFRAAIADALAPGSAVIDVGGGRTPAIPPAGRPPALTYIGIDISRAELEAAPGGAYDRTTVADVTTHIPELDGSADMVVSWQVLEHVRPIEQAFANMHAYLRPGGVLVAHLSGGRSAFAVVNRVIPHLVARWVMHRLLQRDPASVFPAPYDSCTYTALSRILEGWAEVKIVPRYRGAGYFGFCRPLQALYLRFEDMLVRGEHRDAATHYLIVARR
jgi:SAM-dependent methyltransferase